MFAVRDVLVAILVVAFAICFWWSTVRLQSGSVSEITFYIVGM